MKKILFVLVCFVLFFMMLVCADKLSFLGEEDMGCGMAAIAIICAVITAGVNNKYIAALTLFIGFGCAFLLGFVSGGIYVVGLAAIIWMTIAYPEVKKMISGLWAPEKGDEDEDDDKEK